MQTKLYGDPGDYICTCEWCTDKFIGEKKDNICPRCEVIFPVEARAALKGTFPVTLYFPTAKERDEYMAKMQKDNPRLRGEDL